MKLFPSIVDLKGLRCPFYRKKGYKLEHCISFRKIFDEKHKVGVQEGLVNIINPLFPKLNDKGRAHATMGSKCEMRLKELIKRLTASQIWIKWLKGSKICLN